MITKCYDLYILLGVVCDESPTSIRHINIYKFKIIKI